MCVEEAANCKHLPSISMKEMNRIELTVSVSTLGPENRNIKFEAH